MAQPPASRARAHAPARGQDGTAVCGEHWLAATWRPIVMLTFAGLIVARWMGWSAPGIGEAEVLKLWSIVELGLGGYVIGRTAEKIAPTLASMLGRRE